MMKSLSIFSTLVFLSTSVAFSQSNTINRSSWTMKDFWQETQLKFETVLRGEINSNTCLQNFAIFTGCVNGLSHGITDAKEDGKRYYLIPSSARSEIRGFEIITLEFKNPKDMKDKLDQYEKRLKAWYDEYKSSSVVRPLNFDAAYSDFKKVYVQKSNESYLTANIYNAFLEKLVDPHTYITPTHYQDEMHKGEEDVGGEKGVFGYNYLKFQYLGEDKLLVTNVFKNSAAEAAGLEAGDIILSIDGVTTFKDQVKIEKNVIEFELDGSAGRRKITIKRAPLTSDTVESSLHKSINNRSIGYIKFSTFMDDTGCSKIINAGKKLIERGAEGIILDLRDNGGGLVDVAVCINQQFLEDGSLTFVNQDLQTGQFHGEVHDGTEGIFKNIHTAVLINGRSASASEIVSTYLQSYRKAFIVGENSFGKGTMQNVGSTQNSLVMLAQTVAKYYGPDGVSPQIQGVIPDIEAYPVYEQTKPSEYTRERDLYSNAIANSITPPLVMEDRIAEVKLIKQCLDQDQAAFKAYDKKDQFKKRVHDNQKSVAIATLECAIKNRIPIFKRTNIPTKFQ